MSRINLLKLALAFVVVFFSGVGSTWAGHRHGHGHFGVVINPWSPFYYPYSARPYYYPPAYYPPAYYPPAVVQAPPPVYVEQQVNPPPVAVPQTNYWYYCPASKSYYPYVKKCRQAWQKVLPQQP